MITFDGHRSMLRRPFAQRKLDQIKDMDLPAKNLLWDGFRIRVWQQGDLDGGRITAPMGAVVVLSGLGGIKIARSEYWLGGFASPRDEDGNIDQDKLRVHVLNKSGGAFTANLLRATQEDLEALGYSTEPFIMQILYAYFGMEDDYTNPTYYDIQLPGKVGLMPLGSGEFVELTISEHLYPGPGVGDHKQIFESSRMFFSSRGDRLSRSLTRLEHDDPTVTQYYNYCQILEPGWKALFKGSIYDQAPPYKVCVHNLYTPDDGEATYATFIPLSYMIPSGAMPSDLRTLLLRLYDGTNATLSCFPVGGYSFLHEGEQVVLTVVNATTDFIWGTPLQSSDLYQYFETNPDQAHWKLFYCLKVGNIVYVVNSLQFMPLFDFLASSPIGPSGSVDWVKALRLMRRLSQVYPNDHQYVPYDSIMFHDHDGRILTWTRHYGTVVFSTGGLIHESIILPTEVTNNVGVRPEITYAGTFNGTPTYTCICNEAWREVKAVYYGSPYTGWTKIPSRKDIATPEPHIVHVRPVKVEPEDPEKEKQDNIFLLGVAKVDGMYHFTSNDGQGWVIRGKLPFEPEVFDNFQVSLYGNDPMVNAVAAYKTQQPIVQQKPFAYDYNLYSIGML